jgi:hypothetical protein
MSEANRGDASASSVNDFGDRADGTASAEAEERAHTAQRMLSHAGHRILLVLDRVRDKRAEMAAMQCADYLGVRRAWRVEAPLDGGDDDTASETSETPSRSVRPSHRRPQPFIHFVPSHSHPAPLRQHSQAPPLRSNSLRQSLPLHIHRTTVEESKPPSMTTTLPPFRPHAHRSFAGTRVLQGNAGNTATPLGAWKPVNMEITTFDSVEDLLHQLKQHMMPIWVMSNATPWPNHKLGRQKKKMVRLRPPVPALRLLSRWCT